MLLVSQLALGKCCTQGRHLGRIRIKSADVIEVIRVGHSESDFDSDVEVGSTPSFLSGYNGAQSEGNGIDVQFIAIVISFRLQLGVSCAIVPQSSSLLPSIGRT